MATADVGAASERLLEDAADPVVLTDAQRRVLWMNRAARAWFGEVRPGSLFCADVLGCQGRDQKSLRVAPSCFGLSCLSLRSPVTSANMVVRGKDGMRVPVSATYSYTEALASSGGLLITLHDLRPHLAWTERRVAQAKEESVVRERARLAQDLHDGVAQTLASVKLTGALVKRRAEAGDVKGAGETAVRLTAMADAAWQELRRMLGAFRPQSGGLLKDAVTEVLEPYMGAAKPEIVVENLAGDLRLDPERQHQVVNIVREAVSNAVRHSGAERVYVSLGRNAFGLTLEVRDDGCGIGHAASSSGEHFGLMFMEERAVSINGKVHVVPLEPAGTVVRLFVPLDQPGTARQD